MQILRNITWRLVGLTFIALLAFAIYSYFNFHSHETELPKQTLIAVPILFIIGIINRFKLLKIPGTLLHECGHAMIGSLIGGKIRVIRVEKDTSGVTYTSVNRSRIKVLPLAIAGPLATPIFLLFTSLLITQDTAVYWISFIFVSVAAITITTVRSVWGWISAAIVEVALYFSFRLSFDFSSEPQPLDSIGIWTSSSLNVALLLAVFMAGRELGYSWRCRKPWGSNQDEVKVGWALFSPPRVGGWFVFLCNLAIVAASAIVIYNVPVFN